MQEQEYWALHELYHEIADYLDVDFQGTEYEDHGVEPHFIHSSKKDHKEAIRLISKLLEEQTDLGVEELEKWHEEYENEGYEYRGRHGPENPIEK